MHTPVCKHGKYPPDSRFVSKLSSLSSCSEIQLSITLCSDAALTLHLVGQRTRKPGVSRANSAFNFSNILSRFGEYFSNFDFSLVVSNPSRKFLTSLTISLTAKLLTQFGTQVKFRWSRDRNDRTAENAFSAPWFFPEMELEPAAG